MQPLRAVRRGHLVSIEDLAARAGVSTKTIVEIEYGRSVPQLRTIRRLSAALDVDPASVIEFANAIAGTAGTSPAARREEDGK